MSSFATDDEVRVASIESDVEGLQAQVQALTDLLNAKMDFDWREFYAVRVAELTA
jgi:hypothetical protein